MAKYANYAGLSLLGMVRLMSSYWEDDYSGDELDELRDNAECERADAYRKDLNLQEQRAEADRLEAQRYAKVLDELCHADDRRRVEKAYTEMTNIVEASMLERLEAEAVSWLGSGGQHGTD